jgi:hypothetical protein
MTTAHYEMEQYEALSATDSLKPNSSEFDLDSPGQPAAKALGKLGDRVWRLSMDCTFESAPETALAQSGCQGL